MKNRMYKVSDRRNYSLFVIPEGEDTMEYLARNYPYKVMQKNLYITKNKNQNLCYLFNDISEEKERILSSRYVLNRNKKYSGKIFARSENFAEELMLDEGKLVYDRLVSPEKIESGKKLYEFKNIQEADVKDILHKVTKDELIKKITVVFTITLLSLIAFFMLVNGIRTAALKKYEEKIRIEEVNKAKILEQKKDNEELLKLKNEYEAMIRTSNKKIYPVINLLYENIGNKSVVNSLSIQKNSFSLDLMTQNSLEILSSFESDANIEHISINRTANDSGREIVSFAGQIKNIFERPDDNLSLKEKIVFYRNLLKERTRENVFSEYAKEVRRLIKLCSCTEEYMQVRDINGFIELECSLRGSGSNILNLVKSIGENEKNIEIKSFRIKNNQNSSFCNADIVFETFIEAHKVSESEIADFVSKEKMPDEIGVVFKKTGRASGNVQRSGVRQKTPKAAVINKTEKKQSAGAVAGKLDYIGKGANEKYSKIIFLKNPVTGLIYKVPVTDADVSGDHAIEHNDKYQVFIGASEYEVKK
ncbi:MAG: hypothetical protein K6E69_08280 [Treponema sp.]|uniref:hypothetical protein n=1 Tax=Treponema sp. TaxID=166 RepID=UPI00298DAAEA|nr:hypothetical protein [Treponema sp.]MCR5387103.1 hypothetical protein [Treponema sp.]